MQPFDGKRRVCFLAMPIQDNPRKEAMRAALSFSASNRTDAFVWDVTGSLLNYNFNCAWAQFINSSKFDYFCMLHADVQPLTAPGTSWLDVLLDELDKGYDVMHAPVAIKDEKGHTSTALGNVAKQHQWVRKITSRELQLMPDTFGVEHVVGEVGLDGYSPADRLCLLPNTGCMAVRWDPKWRRFPGFSSSDRLVIRTEDGTHILPSFNAETRTDDELPDDVLGDIVPMVLSEDWNFGLWCARHGARVGCTKKVITNHWGVGCFCPARVWGEVRDESFFNAKGKL
jgi:hypothetical protein